METAESSPGREQMGDDGHTQTVNTTPKSVQVHVHSGESSSVSWERLALVAVVTLLLVQLALACAWAIWSWTSSPSTEDPEGTRCLSSASVAQMLAAASIKVMDAIIIRLSCAKWCRMV